MTIDERIQEIKNAKRKLIMGNPSDAIEIIITRNPYWDCDYIDQEWFIEELDEEIRNLEWQKEHAEEIKEEMRNIKWQKYTPKKRSGDYIIEFV